MAVAHDASSESHTGTTGSASEASFGWTHTPSGTPAGVLVFTFVNANANDATAVDYGGSALTAVSGGRAVDTAVEAGDCKAWFLGSSVPTGAQTVTVTRNNNANVMYAVAITVTAAGDVEVYTTGIVLLQEDGTLAEQSVDDGSPGTNSVRYAGINSGLASIPAVGANSTALLGIDFGTRVVGTARETTAGQGARSVGFSNGTSEDRAGVHLAVREVASGNITATPSTVAAVASVPAPTVIAESPATATPATVAAVAAVPSPSILTGATANLGQFSPLLRREPWFGPIATKEGWFEGDLLLTEPLLGAASGDVAASPATVAAVAAIPAPTIIATSPNATATPATVAAIAAVPAPTVQAAAVATPSTVAAVASVPAPTVLGAARPTPATVAAVASVPAPTVAGAARATPATVAATASVPAPTVLAGAITQPATVAAVASVPAPTVLAGGNVTVAPATVAAVASVPAPTVQATASTTPATVAALVTIPAPTVRGAVIVGPATVAALAEVPTPTFGEQVVVFLTEGDANATAELIEGRGSKPGSIEGGALVGAGLEG